MPEPRSTNWSTPLGGDEAHGAAQEAAVLPDDRDRVRCGGDQPVTEGPVGGEVVRAAEEVVVDPGDAGRFDVDSAGYPRRPVHIHALRRRDRCAAHLTHWPDTTIVIDT